jgi:hypothetical protein
LGWGGRGQWFWGRGGGGGRHALVARDSSTPTSCAVFTRTPKVGVRERVERYREGCAGRFQKKKNPLPLSLISLPTYVGTLTRARPCCCLLRTRSVNLYVLSFLWKRRRSLLRRAGRGQREIRGSCGLNEKKMKKKWSGVERGVAHARARRDRDAPSTHFFTDAGPASSCRPPGPWVGQAP